MIAWAGAVTCLVAAVGGVAAYATLTGILLLAMPLGLLLSVLILPVVLAGLVFLSARLQARNDRRPGLSGRES
jgi:hypothetical protein